MNTTSDSPATMEHRPHLSIVLPVYNEQDNLEPLYAEICEALGSMDFEILFVDDGSNDESRIRLKRIQSADARVRVVIFRRNFGQTAAMAAGLALARGRTIATLDADRQNDPRDIPAMLEKLEEGFDMVCGWRHKRQDGFLLRLLPSMIANRLISYTTDVKLHDYGCTLKVMRADVAKQIRLYGEMHRFIPAIASWFGVSIAEMKVNHRPRVAGRSKYGISRTLRVVLDLMTVKFLLGYAGRPIQFFGSLGLAFGLLGMMMMSSLLIDRLVFQMPLGGRPALLFAVLMIFMGLQFITFGLLAEMQTRTYYESQGKTIYSIREIIESEKSAP